MKLTYTGDRPARAPRVLFEQGIRIVQPGETYEVPDDRVDEAQAQRPELVEAE